MGRPGQGDAVHLPRVEGNQAPVPSAREQVFSIWSQTVNHQNMCMMSGSNDPMAGSQDKSWGGGTQDTLLGDGYLDRALDAVQSRSLGASGKENSTCKGPETGSPRGLQFLGPRDGA